MTHVGQTAQQLLGTLQQQDGASAGQRVTNAPGELFACFWVLTEVWLGLIVYERLVQTLRQQKQPNDVSRGLLNGPTHSSAQRARTCTLVNSVSLLVQPHLNDGRLATEHVLQPLCFQQPIARWYTVQW
jgi:hypothetical protein